MGAISKSMHKPIQEKYPYLSLTVSIEIITNTSQQEKEVLAEYMERF